MVRYRMQRDAFVFGVTVVAVAVGLAVLIAGEAYGIDSAILVGGVVVLLGVGGMTGYLAALDGRPS